ncbi:MAG: AtpZ/AtpI family protein [Dethiobacter sp.]|jgi:F0F1-type ATP synthase assembly protein I|nr:MAG: AtpZ/AtpI family protein [Dethiobacter sp.]
MSSAGNEKQVNLLFGFKPEDLSGLLLATRLAFSIVLPLITALLVGRYLGRIFGYEALFIIVSVLSGLYAGFRQAMRMLLKK